MIIKRDDDFMDDLYWFWYKYVHYKTKSLRGMPERFDSQFNKMLVILETKYNMRGLKEGKYNGQTKAEFDKEIIDFKDKKVFKDASVYCCITIFTKENKDFLIYNDKNILS